MNSDDKVLYDKGFKKATSAAGKTETVILKGESHKIITTPTLLSSASKEHDPSDGSTAIYSDDKMTIGDMAIRIVTIKKLGLMRCPAQLH